MMPLRSSVKSSEPSFEMALPQGRACWPLSVRKPVTNGSDLLGAPSLNLMRTIS